MATAPDLNVPAAPATLRQGRWGVVVACVVLLHGLVLWGVQRALERPWLRPVEALLSMSVKLIVPPASPAAPQMAPRSVAPPAPPARQPLKPVTRRAPQVEPQPAPRAEPQPQPALEAPAGQVAEAAAIAAAPSGIPAGPPAPSSATATAAAAPSFSQEAQCPGNSPPPYPATSMRRGETGRVVVGVLIGTDGQVHEVKLQRSSGHTRLDDAALQAVRYWRCQPVVRDDVPQTQWRIVPVDFILQS